MTKNMFFLVAIYFFVIQAIIAGIMRNQNDFFVLAWINFAFLMLIALLHGYFKSKKSDEVHEIESSKSILTKTQRIDDHKELQETITTTKTFQLVEDEDFVENEEQTEYENTEHWIQWQTDENDNNGDENDMIKKAKQIREEELEMEKNNKSSKWTWKVFVLFLVSLVISYFFYYFSVDFIDYWIRTYTISSILWLVVFLILSISFAWKSRKIWGILFYIILTLLCLVYAIYVWISTQDKDFYKYTNWTFDKAFDFILSISSWDDVDDINIFVGSGEVIDIVVDTGANNTWNIYTWEVILDLQDDNLDLQDDNITNILLKYWLEEWWNIQIIQAIKYLIDSNNIKFDNSKNITFTYVATSNDNYKYFKTAAREWMIGKSTNPETNITCDTYIVMKGLAENWNVWNYSDVKLAYWEKATELDKLNWCEKWALVISETL